ncbi:winged helix-turn-helix transcriptional regulator [Lacisediminihabitans sp.]|uniref:winged helix-turn-helix transcriptional regulator n=1 Tax=Lacisediminihabitans sp. TaxID=2787631 RepID=UPI00374CDE01
MNDETPDWVMDVLDVNCPSRDVFVDLADKWSLLLLVSLRFVGAQRFSELQRSVGGISRAMLAQSLKSLERDGVVVRDVDGKVAPPRVVYDLTPLGEELADESRVLCDWSQRRSDEVHAARKAFDESRSARDVAAQPA